MRTVAGSCNESQREVSVVDLDRVHERLETLGTYLRELRRLSDLPPARAGMR